ncbi:MAG: glycosyltransferase [Flavobacteriaceae bacterium]|nr:glycosyltransferase [Flavobacteriaceae bacterium]
MNKKKLNILFVNSWYPSRVFPQNGDFIQRHAEAVALKHRITSLHVVTDPAVSKTEISDRTINEVRTLIAYVKPTKPGLLKLIQFTRTYFSLLKKVGPFDLVQVNRIYPAGLIGLFIKYKYAKPLLLTEHFTGYLPERAVGLDWLEKKITAFICAKADHIATVSDNLNRSMQQLGFKNRFSVVPNVVDTDLFQAKNKKSEVFNILHISSMLDKHKNVSGILRVIKRLEMEKVRFRFVMIGEGSSQYLPLIKELGIRKENVFLKEQIPHQEIALHMQAADLFVLFSNYENLPCVILEAFSAGVPVISTDIGGISAFFPEDFGKLIPVKDEEALFYAIRNQMKKPAPDKVKMHGYAG